MKTSPLQLAAILKANNIDFVCLPFKGNSTGAAYRLALDCGYPKRNVFCFGGVFYVLSQKPRWVNTLLGRG